MSDVLNPGLFRRLKRHFGTVKVTNQGEAMVARPVYDHGGQPRLYFDQDGEYYCVCCPYCTDTRYRLYVNHMYGKRDGHGRRMKFLAICFNEGCLYEQKHEEDFREILEDTGNFLEAAKIKDGVVLPEEARTVQPPGPCITLDRLRKNHPARVYLESRDFDVDMLARRYGVSYCRKSHYFLAKNRIIIPVLEKGRLKGWQARFIGDLDWKGPKRSELQPKYFSCPDSQFRSRCLYNWDKAVEWETLIVVEGPSDVWRFGAMSACCFGNSLTQQQKKRVRTRFRSRTAVLLLDPEEFESKSTKRTIEEFDNVMPGRFCAIKLPEGTDPGGTDRTLLRDYIRDEAKKLGVRVKYRKWRKPA